MRPRVLIVITLAEVGGAQTYVAQLLPALTERFDVTVAAGGPGPLVEAARDAGARYVPLRFMRRDLSWREPLALLELVVLCRRLRPRIVHANSSKGGILGRVAASLTGVPLRFFTVHGWAFMQYHGVASHVYLALERLARPLTTCTISVSQRTLEAGIAARTCSADRSVTIRNAVDAAAAPRAALDGEPPRLISVGRLKEPKDFLGLVRALRSVDVPFSAAIVGDGPDRAGLEPEARGVVELLGERDDVPEQLAASDVFALASRSEGMPVSVLEAMAAGLPVVATAVGGIPELVVDGETGLLVPASDEGALAEALRRVLGDADLRRRLGATGRRRVEEEFDLPRFRQAHVELYERELARTGVA